ncbi:MAG: hypothetical protein ABSB38_09920 [Dehalococcoidia bacterium]
MKISRQTLCILLPVIVLVVLGAVLAGFACTPPGTMPTACQQWYDKGKLEGYNDGYNAGKTEGQSTGYNEGYAKGLQAGTALCPQCPTCPQCPQQQQQYPYYYPYQYYYPYPYYDQYNRCPSCEPSP